MTGSNRKTEQGRAEKGSQTVTRGTAKVTQSAARRPNRLDELLYQVNLVPANAVLRNFFEVYEMIWSTQETVVTLVPGSRALRGKSPAAAREQALRICLEDHDELAEYIRRRSEEEKIPLGYSWQWYELIRDARERLQTLISGQMVATVGGWISIDSQGLFSVGRDFFAEAIDGVDARKLRRCEREDCRRIFFAKKPNQRYCKAKCTNVVRNRLARFLESQGFIPDARLKQRDIERKKELITRWHADRMKKT